MEYGEIGVNAGSRILRNTCLILQHARSGTRQGVQEQAIFSP